ncbi:MAG: PEP-CTERM sorting domain-containing protein [Gemmatimonadota bacterium]
MSNRSIVAFAAAIVLFGTPTAARAQWAINTAPGAQTDVLTDGPWSIGYSFNVTTNFTVQRLGYLDWGNYGLLESHDVGIFSPSGTLLVSGTLSGENQAIDGLFRSLVVAPTLLVAGNNYRIMGFDPGGADAVMFDGYVSSVPEIQYVGAAYCLSFSLSDSCGSYLPGGYFGPNFAGTSEVATPEPAAIILLATGFVCVIGAARRRRQV